jgi:hypothetical protein
MNTRHDTKRSDRIGLGATLLGVFLSLAAAADAQEGFDGGANERWLNGLPVWRSHQLGFDYQFAEYEQFQSLAMVARVASTPLPGSAATRITRNDNGQVITLEPGDLVLAMDEMAFLNRADFDAHMGETTIYFRDGRTGLFGVGKAVLPAEVTPGQLVKGNAGFDPDFTFPWSKPQAEPFAADQAETRSLLLQSIGDGEVQLDTPKVRLANGSVSRMWMPMNRFSGPAHRTVHEQALVESLRLDLGDPVLNQTMAAALPNVERVIDRQLLLLNQDRADLIKTERLDQQIEFQYLYAVFAFAAARGQPIPPFEPLPRFAPAAPPFFVKLFSQRNATEIYYMARLNWWIITRSKHRQPREEEWSKCKPGEAVSMIGYYAFFTKYPDGSADAPRDDLHIIQNGDFFLP